MVPGPLLERDSWSHPHQHDATTIQRRGHSHRRRNTCPCTPPTWDPSGWTPPTQFMLSGTFPNLKIHGVSVWRMWPGHTWTDVSSFVEQSSWACTYPTSQVWPFFAHSQPLPSIHHHLVAGLMSSRWILFFFWSGVLYGNASGAFSMSCLG